MSSWRASLLAVVACKSKLFRLTRVELMNSRDEIPCYKKKGASKRCASCSTGSCPFTLPLPLVVGPSPILMEVIGRLETLAVTEGNAERKRVLEVCAADLRTVVVNK